jgi:hypothetical protein
LIKIGRQFITTSSVTQARPCTRRFFHNVEILFVAVFAILTVSAQQVRGTNPAAQTVQSFALTDANALVLSGGEAQPVEYQGRKAVLLTTKSEEGVFAFLKDAHYELFYLRPGNSQSEDQAMRNHSVQYVAAPGFDWYKLRREWPWLYESHADLRPEVWTKVKIEVRGRSARLYVNGSDTPSLVVHGLKGEDLQGGVALWGYAGEDAYFSNLKITHAQAQPIEDGGEAAGTWDVNYASDYGRFAGSMNLHREGGVVTGTWSGAFGPNQPISGTWRNGYVELSFSGTWPNGKPGPLDATLVGWIDGDSATGRMKVEGRADGQWTAVRKK